ncbi:ATPase subunit 4 [Cucumis melo var. makuwa]|uniref:ATPase subunit 4 (Mitochondrion) n=1 Tax=Cucumis melo var. makuwa TaxID=1194695 RepID=A0A5D3D1D0_CUCMM|nr:ATPase subunit 4 [Cucumis melo var. makuwa]TYK18051.1 ATPase subunit 4 [Cucumis melo var. makuwa]
MRTKPKIDLGQEVLESPTLVPVTSEGMKAPSEVVLKKDSLRYQSYFIDPFAPWALSTIVSNATSSCRIRLQDNLVTSLHFSVSDRFVLKCTLKASIVHTYQELAREGSETALLSRRGQRLDQWA